eukprot:g12851.t1
MEDGALDAAYISTPLLLLELARTRPKHGCAKQLQTLAILAPLFDANRTVDRTELEELNGKQLENHCLDLTSAGLPFLCCIPTLFPLLDSPLYDLSKPCVLPTSTTKY